VRNNTVDPLNNSDLAALINELRAEVRGLAARVAALEQPAAPAQAAAPAVAQPAAAAAPALPAAAAAPAKPEVTEEDMLMIAAAVAAYLGVRARIRQVRLIQSSAWAQVGRATVHASHRVH
jgi:methylmalonyl-CoA carboxyltransferase large subunit